MALVADGRPVEVGQRVDAMLVGVVGFNHRGPVLVGPTRVAGTYAGTTSDGALEVLDASPAGAAVYFAADDVIAIRVQSGT